MKQRKQSQHYVFAYEALAVLFLTQNHRFLDMIEKDGNKFLKFWWDYAGTNIAPEFHVEPKGLGSSIRKLENGATVVMVTLPEPKLGEAFFIALHSPKRRPFLFWKNYPVHIALERGENPDGSLKPIMAYWTSRGRHVYIGPGPDPDLETFYQVVMLHLYKKPVNLAS